jgi:hypothetical protein
VSEEWSEIIKILNCGFQDGFPVLRTEDDNGRREPRSYDCYSPKILATRGEFKDKALESRCLTEKVMETARNDIPIILDDGFKTAESLLRNKMLLFRFRHYGKHVVNPTHQDETIEKRLNQIMLPIYSIINDQEMRDEIRSFMQEYNKKLIGERGESFDAKVLEVMFNIISDRLDDGRINENLYVKTITDKLNEEFHDQAKKITAHKVSWIIRKKLFLDLVKDRNGRFIIWNVPMFYKFVKKYGICDDVTFVTLLRGISDTSSHTPQNKTIDDFKGYCDDGGVSPP